MKKLFIYTTGIVLSFTVFSSCDHVANPVPSGGSTTSTTSTTSDTATALRKVLIEDFTGHKCTNCPDATRTIDKLQHTAPTNYGDMLVAVAIHAATNFATPDAVPPYTYDFRTSPGNVVHSSFGAYYYPSGMVNRISYNSTTKAHIKGYSAWGSISASMINKPADVKITIKNTYDGSNRQLTSGITCKFQKAKTGTYKLTVYVTEDSLVRPQVDNKATPNDVPNYTHRHVLRAAINTSGVNTGDGDLLKAGSILKGESFEKSYTYAVPLNDPKNSGFTYNEKHMHVIAFVYDDDPASPTYKEILQVEEMKVK